MHQGGSTGQGVNGRNYFHWMGTSLALEPLLYKAGGGKPQLHDARHSNIKFAGAREWVKRTNPCESERCRRNY
jgi:hypothetical protein